MAAGTRGNQWGRYFYAPGRLEVNRRTVDLMVSGKWLRLRSISSTISILSQYGCSFFIVDYILRLLQTVLFLGVLLNSEFLYEKLDIKTVITTEF